MMLIFFMLCAPSQGQNFKGLSPFKHAQLACHRTGRRKWPIGRDMLIT